MYFLNIIKELSKENNLTIFVDMDGVIAEYDIVTELNFKTKRPLKTNINILKEINEIDNIKLCILSICREDYQIKDKNDWLDKYALFFNKENRYIISKESNPNKASKELKRKFIEKYKKENSDETIVIIDDDNEILKEYKNNIKDIVLFQDSSLID